MAGDCADSFMEDLGRGIMRLKDHLLQVKDMKKHSLKLVEEIGIFMEALETNLDLLKSDLPPSVFNQALGSLSNEVKEANKFMEEALQQDKFRSVWTVKEARSKLELRRQKLVSAFQLAFFITTLDVALGGCKKTPNFQERMQELHSVYTSDSAVARSQIPDLLQSLVSGVKSQDEKLQSLINYVKSGGSQSTGAESTENQKFFTDVLTAVDELQNSYQLEQLMYDPMYPDDLMWDPVKASDGYTYDRWTLIEYDDHPNDHRSIPDCPIQKVQKSPYTRAPLSIHCDDVTVRQRLYSIRKFQHEGAEKKCKEMREKYRNITLELVMAGHDGEALERLEHVLQWAPDDDECRRHRDEISARLGKSQSSAQPVDEFPSAASNDNLPPQPQLDTQVDECLPDERNENLPPETQLDTQVDECLPDERNENLPPETQLDVHYAGVKQQTVYALLTTIFLALVFVGFGILSRQKEKVALENCLSRLSACEFVSQTCFEDKLEAENKISTLEEELERFNAVVQEFRHRSRLDEEKIRNLEKEIIDFQESNNCRLTDMFDENSLLTTKTEVEIVQVAMWEKAENSPLAATGDFGETMEAEENLKGERRSSLLLDILFREFCNFIFCYFVARLLDRK